MKRSLWLLKILLLALCGCSDFGDDPDNPDDGGGPLEPPPATVSFAADIQPIFTTHCVGCHGDGGNAGLDLRAGVSHGNLVEVAATQSALFRVQPEQPDQSWLYLKLSGQQTVGTEMPPGAPLDSATLGLVQTWIEEGALDN
jgi:mono/diheme cytochrome c family protein